MERFLYYTTYTTEWLDSLPIGNGQLAAMVANDKDEDVLYLNHENLWYCYSKQPTNTILAGARLKEIRRLVSAGKYTEATHLGYPDYVGPKIYAHTDEYTPANINSYKPAGNLHVKFCDEQTFCERKLDIFDAVSSVKRGDSCGEFFVSCANESFIVCHYHGNINCKVYLDRPQESFSTTTIDYGKDVALLHCKTNTGYGFYVKSRLQTDGKVAVDHSGITVTDGSFLTVYSAVFVNETPNDVLPNCNYEQLLRGHVCRFSALMQRTTLQIGTNKSFVPTDKRVENINNGVSDDSLVALYFHYGRYLLLSSSLNGKLPANLQGKWNQDLQPMWKSDYHLDINLQMNYWLAESGNIPEAMDAFFAMFDRFRQNNHDNVVANLGCRGLYLPCMMDNEGTSYLYLHGWGLFVSASSWIAQHYYKHYEYTGNLEFLQKQAYPFFKEVAQFWQDYLVKDKDGVYQIVPSTSPENSFLPDCDIWSTIGQSCAMDVQLCYDLMGFAIKSANALSGDQDMVSVWENIQKRLPPFKIGSDGRLLEWDKEFDEKEPGHRHYSHLYGAFPGELFTSELRTEQFEACKKSLRYRLEHSGGYTGWSRAWTACLFARMGNGDDFLSNIQHLITDFSTASLLDIHPPKIFQIDGNLGGAEAVLQSLVQSRNGKVYLLFALPKQWQDGRLTGVKTAGGHTLDLAWQNGSITNLTITVGFAGKGTIVLPNGKQLTFEQNVGTVVQYNF